MLKREHFLTIEEQNHKSNRYYLPNSSWLIGLAELKHNSSLTIVFQGTKNAIDVSDFWLKLFFFTFMND